MNCDVNALRHLIELSSASDEEGGATTVPWAVITVLGSRAAQASTIRSLLTRLGYVYHEQWFSGMCPTGIWAFVCVRHRIVFLDVDMRQLRTVATAISISSQVLLVHEGQHLTLEDIMVFVHALHYTVKCTRNPDESDRPSGHDSSLTTTDVNDNFARQLYLATKCGVPFLVSAGVSHEAPFEIESDALAMLQSVLGDSGVRALSTPVEHFVPQVPHYLSMMHPSKGALTAPLIGKRSFGDALSRSFRKNLKVIDALTSTQIKSDFEVAQKRSSQYLDGRCLLSHSIHAVCPSWVLRCSIS
jgi:hypothetical protein